MHRRLSQVDSELTVAKQRLNILEQSSEVATSPWKQKKFHGMIQVSLFVEIKAGELQAENTVGRV